jgi:3-oxoacyl-[acyl-carrier-protein] synthase II
MLNKKVYIIDYEVLSPIAEGANNLISSIEKNFCSEGFVNRVDTAGIPFKKAAEIKYDLKKYYHDEPQSLKDACFSDRKLELTVACYGKAKIRMEKLISLFESERTGVIMGVGADVIPLELYEEEIINYASKNLDPLIELEFKINKNDIRLNTVNNPYDIHALYLAQKMNAGAFQRSTLTACVSSTQALAFAADSINDNEADVVIAGGTDSLVNLVAMSSFGKLGVIPESREALNCRPFDVNRNGALAGECAGFVIMASEEFVEKHNLKPVAEFMGYGNTLDAYKITAPDPEGSSITLAIKNAIENSGIDINQIDYINAHGTGTKHNDQLELKCLVKALGQKARSIPISSTKDRHGHAIAAAGIQEVCLLIELMKNNTIPANLNLLNPCDSDFNLIRENFKSPIEFALTNNFSFGGVNTVLVLKNKMI